MAAAVTSPASPPLSQPPISPSGSDPVFIGASGVPYEVRAEPNVTYNLVSAPALYVNGRFLQVPPRFRGHELTHTVLGDVAIALCACPRSADAGARGGGKRGAARGTRSPCERRVRFPWGALEQPTLDGRPLRVGVTPLPGGRAVVNYTRHVCDPVEGSCYWQSLEPDEFDVHTADADEPAPHRTDEPTLFRTLVLELPSLSLVLERQHVLASVPAHLRARVEVCAKGARAGVTECKHAMAAVLLHGAAAAHSEVFGYNDLSMRFKPLPAGGAYEPMHGLLGQHALLGAGRDVLEQPRRTARVQNEPVRGRLGRALGAGAESAPVEGDLAMYVVGRGVLFGGERYAYSLFDPSCSAERALVSSR